MRHIDGKHAISSRSIRITERCFCPTRPIRRVNALLDQAMKCRIRPIAYPFDQFVLHWVDVYIIHVRPKIRLIAYQVFPITPLPYSPLAPVDANLRTVFERCQRLGKSHLYQPPARREIGIGRGQFNDAVQRLGQYNPAVDRERMALPYRFHRFPQSANMPGQQVIFLPLQQVDGEEICAARMPGASVIGYDGSIALIFIRRNARWLLRPTRVAWPEPFAPASFCWRAGRSSSCRQSTGPSRGRHRAAGWRAESHGSPGTR